MTEQRLKSVRELEVMEFVDLHLGVVFEVAVAPHGEGVGLRRQSVAVLQRVVGDSVELIVSLPEGYKMGDLAWICLPSALSRVQGGGQLKRFVCDFEGRDQIRIPLAATRATTTLSGRLMAEHLLVRVRNMYEEERIGSPAALAVSVENGGPTSG